MQTTVTCAHCGHTLTFDSEQPAKFCIACGQLLPTGDAPIAPPQPQNDPFAMPTPVTTPNVRIEYTAESWFGQLQVSADYGQTAFVPVGGMLDLVLQPGTHILTFTAAKSYARKIVVANPNAKFIVRYHIGGHRTQIQITPV